MAGPSTSVILLLSCLQIFIIVNTDGLTLPLQTITTKCESTKKPQKRDEMVTAQEKQETDNLPPDFYHPFLPTDPFISASSIVSPIPKPLDDWASTSSKEITNNIPSLVPKDASTLATSIDDADYKINLLHTPSDMYLNTKNSILLSDPGCFSDNYLHLSFDSTNDLNLSALKLPSESNSMSYTVSTNSNLQASDNSDENKIDFPDTQSNAFKADSDASFKTLLANLGSPTEPIFSDKNLLLPSNSLSSGTIFSLPVCNSITSTIDPLNLDLTFIPNRTETPTFLNASPLNFSSSPDENLLPLLFDATSFTLPQMIPNSISNLKELILPCNLSIPPAETIPVHSKSSLETPMESKTSFHSDINRLDLFNLSENLSVPSSQALSPLDSCKASLIANSVNNVDTLNTKREIAEIIPTNPSLYSNFNSFELKPCAASPISSSVTQNSKAISPLREFLNSVMPQTLLFPSSIPDMSSPIASFTSLLAKDQSSNLLSDACTPTSSPTAPLVTSLKPTKSNNQFVSASQCDNLLEASTSGKIPSLSTTSGAFVTELPGSPILDANVVTLPVVSTSSLSLLNTNPLETSTENTLASLDIPLLSKKHLIPIEKYFEDVRSVTAKLNEFITSFSSRSSSPCTVSSFLDIMPPSITLSQPNLIPLYDQVSPEIPTELSTVISDTTLSFPSKDQDLPIITPIVPKTIINTFHFPITSTPSVPDSMSSGAYSNFSPFNNLPIISSNTDLLGTSHNSPCLSPFGSFPEIPYTCPPSSVTPIVRNPSSSMFPNSVCTFDDGFTDTLIPDTLSVSSENFKNKGLSFPKKQHPFLSSLSVNAAVTSEETMGDSSILPNLGKCSANLSSSSKLLVPSPAFLDGVLMNSCCEDVEKMIALLELSMILNGEADCDINSLSGVLSLL